jgi:hypothetical protein
MSSSGKVGQERGEQEGESSKGPTLTLLYSLLGAALLIAMGLAALIVLPFYHRH